MSQGGSGGISNNSHLKNNNANNSHHSNRNLSAAMTNAQSSTAAATAAANATGQNASSIISSSVPGGLANHSNAEGDDTIQFPYCDDVNKYEKIGKIGQGTFGEVFKARHLKTKKLVALKKVLMENEKEGFPITALREIKILQLLKHENVIPLIEICRTSSTQPNYKATFYLVFEFCEHDLAGLLSNVNVKFSLGEIKKVMQQLLNGLFFIHKQKILHRDMKAANILITKSGVLKLADFGLARAISEVKSDSSNRYTNRVVTLWYRPPELLLGARNYGPPIDLWGAGCIMAEMWTRTPILQGSTEQAQLTLISQLCGSITPEVWPGVERLELFAKLELIKGQRRRVKERLKVYIKSADALDLLDKLLTLDPAHRIDSDSALNHDFFWNDPLPTDLSIMLSHYNNSMFEFTTSRRRQVLPQGQVGVPPGQAGGPLAAHGNFHPVPGHQGRPGGPPGAPGAVAATNAGGGQYMDRVF